MEWTPSFKNGIKTVGIPHAFVGADCIRPTWLQSASLLDCGSPVSHSLIPAFACFIPKSSIYSIVHGMLVP